MVQARRDPRGLVGWQQVVAGLRLNLHHPAAGVLDFVHIVKVPASDQLLAAVVHEAAPGPATTFSQVHIAGPDGAIDWAAPDEELMRFHNEQTRELTGHLSGRGLYEDMLGWETAEQTRTEPRELEFARMWKAIPKVVFSTSLTAVEGNARLARSDVADEVAELKNQPGAGIVSVGGARLAAGRSGRVDAVGEYPGRACVVWLNSGGAPINDQRQTCDDLVPVGHTPAKRTAGSACPPRMPVDQTAHRH